MTYNQNIGTFANTCQLFASPSWIMCRRDSKKNDKPSSLLVRARLNLFLLGIRYLSAQKLVTAPNIICPAGPAGHNVPESELQCGDGPAMQWESIKH